jgi:Rrf2 family protein
MLVSQKSRYALRAVFELSKRYGRGPVKISEIAERQSIPPRFLEVILSQLKQAGFLGSRRGSDGGYFLTRQPGLLSVGDVMRFTQGEVLPRENTTGGSSGNGTQNGDTVFQPMWEKVGKAISDVYDGTNFRTLVEEEEQKSKKYVPTYSI